MTESWKIWVERDGLYGTYNNKYVQCVEYWYFCLLLLWFSCGVWLSACALLKSDSYDVLYIPYLLHVIGRKWDFCILQAVFFHLWTLCANSFGMTLINRFGIVECAAYWLIVTSMQPILQHLLFFLKTEKYHQNSFSIKSFNEVW